MKLAYMTIKQITIGNVTKISGKNRFYAPAKHKEEEEE